MDPSLRSIQVKIHGYSDMDKEVNEMISMASLRVRHRVQTQHIVQVNGCLSSFQKERLKSTPFKWLVDMVDNMVISSPILIELISLPSVGESVNLESDVGGIVNDLFKDEDITIFSFGAFYFPRNSNVINSVPFSKLDNINDLNIYNWGDDVHGLIVSSLNRACNKYNRRSYHEVIHIAGCATVLQLWVVEHISLYHVGGRCIYPRFLHWVVIKDKRKRIKLTFQQTEQLDNDEIKESQTNGGKSNPESNDENLEFARLVEDQRVLRRRVDKHAERPDELEMKIRRLQEEVRNEMPSFNDGMEGPSTDDKMNDLTIVNFVDVGMEGASRHENIDFGSVYTTCTSSLCNDGDVALVEVSNNILTRGDLQCFRPRAKIDNIVMLFATAMTVYNQLHKSGMITRCCFNPFFALFVPTMSDDHWWCYCVSCQSREFFIIDSLGHKRRTRYGIDKAMVGCLQELFNMIDNEANCKEQQLKVRLWFVGDEIYGVMGQPI
ncbi:uncharacterized protein LOC108344169 [Vigna angularis]|uniref:uncharacterized protein LOC108344169 n=1 Tax=Phaseolus angularis TaxID=3914 RepID=UPI000809BF14|nr:uncharacterized protein LOC108344169 [Vigna angularis]